jgi:acid phosphatase
LGHTAGQDAGITTNDWNILYHLGGNGPWIEKLHDVVDGGIALPNGCEVEQVHMMSRHAERYPTVKAGTRMKHLFKKMKESKVDFKGDLSFVKNWELFWSDDAQLAQLTSTGPFSGTLGAYTTGVRLRTRYQHLIPKDKHTKLWASDSQRVIDTARYLAAGFFGLDWPSVASLQVIPETSDIGADTLTPGDTCANYISDTTEGWAKGWKAMHAYRATYFPSIRARLISQNPGLNFTDDELYAMQELCGFETTVRGSSPWCHVFTRSDFLAFEYARDVHHYYRAGPGTPYGAGMGFLWLNATKNLMMELDASARRDRNTEGADAVGRLFFSFVHDDDAAPMLAALDIMAPAEHLPLTHIPEDARRTWRKSQVSPMGGRTIFELMKCGAEGKRFVRVNINDGVTALPGCDSGPGRSCPLDMFDDRVRKKGEAVGSFREMCGLGDDSAERITFLHQ